MILGCVVYLLFIWLPVKHFTSRLKCMSGVRDPGVTIVNPTKIPVMYGYITWRMTMKISVMYGYVTWRISGGSRNCQTGRGGGLLRLKKKYAHHSWDRQPIEGPGTYSPGKYWNLRLKIMRSRAYFGPNTVVFFCFWDPEGRRPPSGSAIANDDGNFRDVW